MNRIIYCYYCDACGEEIYDVNTCKMYNSGPPYYDTIYICKECSDKGKTGKNNNKLTHVDMDGVEAL